MGEYTNYYNDDNTVFTFNFVGISEEQARRIQIYLLQDNKLIIDDDDVLDKLSSEKGQIDFSRPYSLGTITIEQGNDAFNHYVLSGYSEERDISGKSGGKNFSANMYDGKYSFFVEGFQSDKRTNFCKFSSFYWLQVLGNSNPVIVKRINTNHHTLGQQEDDKLDLGGCDSFYEAPRGFKFATSSPMLLFAKKQQQKIMIK